MKSFGKKLVACTLALFSFITMAVAPVSAAGWKRDSTGWRYENPEGSDSRGGFVQISGKWYFFDADGYMKTGWQKSGRKGCPCHFQKYYKSCRVIPDAGQEKLWLCYS